MEKDIIGKKMNLFKKNEMKKKLMIFKIIILNKNMNLIPINIKIYINKK